jgi:hypothetical protein
MLLITLINFVLLVTMVIIGLEISVNKFLIYVMAIILKMGNV